ncbi:transposase, MuDR [Artemisia annua]|uniref:Transposase, MuDR n=1 Tax=Artemisia annua TaxID=35608 RepID=A0A2U1L463_ARTAN|nr:transposase, MuDR [Artemisia annua]
MLCEWRVRKKGSTSNPYNNYRKFPIVFCLKINHGGAFTSHPKVRYIGGKVNWIDTIDSERFSVVEVATMMQELGYENGSSGMDFFYKLPNSDLDNGLRKLETDNALELMTHVSKYKVIDLYVDHCVSKNSKSVEPSLLENVANDSQNVLENADIDVLDDVSEDEWLMNCLSKVGRLENNVGQSSRNESPNVDVGSEHGSDSDSESNSDDSEDSDFVVDEEQMMNNVDVDMAEFKKNIDKNSEWIGYAETVKEVTEVV